MMINDNQDTVEVSVSLVKVAIQLDDPVAGFEVETLWAEPIAGGLHRLRSIPFLVYGYSAQDVVSTAEINERIIVTGVGERGGHSTYRVFLPVPANDEQFRPLWEPLGSLGCTYERANPKLICIDVPPNSNVYAVYDTRGEVSKFWKFEEGHCGQPLCR